MHDEGSDFVRWTRAERLAIVAETYQPGATVAEVARRHGIVASQLAVKSHNLLGGIKPK